MGVTIKEVYVILNSMNHGAYNGNEDAFDFRRKWSEHDGSCVSSMNWILASKHPYVATARVHLLTAYLKGKL